MAANNTADHIEARFHLQRGTFQLQADLQLPGRGVSVLYGHSGAGKTSLLRCIAGLEQADQRFLRVRGQLWDDSRQMFSLPTWKRPLGYVFQEASLFPHLSVRRNLDYGRRRTNFFRKPQKLDQLIELLGLGHLLERMPEHLSGGERQRVAIARALAVCPQVLLMDEPLAALDLQRKQEILPFLTRLTAELEVPILYVTHSPQEVTRLADYLVVLEKGRVLQAGELSSVLTDLNSPMTQDQQAATIIEGTVTGYETAYYLAQVSFPGGKLSLPSREILQPGTPVRLQIYARDVTITLKPIPDSSVINTLPAMIADLTSDQQGQTMVKLNIGGTILLASIAQNNHSAKLNGSCDSRSGSCSSTPFSSPNSCCARLPRRT
ncbi:MAG: molybdenum ABC transporter ATP-binding protein [Thiothrix nivea]|nr:MAG: molybdenum ABC transporter ATP-binding protein [Thiothrix nivea]